MFSKEMGDGVSHCAEVKRGVNVPVSVSSFGALDGVVVDLVGVGFPAVVEGGVERGIGEAGREYPYAMGELGVQGEGKVFEGDAKGIKVEVDDLPEGMDAAIGAARRLQFGFCAEGRKNGFFKGVFNRWPFGFLPPKKVGPFIGNFKGNIVQRLAPLFAESIIANAFIEAILYNTARCVESAERDLELNRQTDGKGSDGCNPFCYTEPSLFLVFDFSTLVFCCCFGKVDECKRLI